MFRRRASRRLPSRVVLIAAFLTTLFLWRQLSHQSSVVFVKSSFDWSTVGLVHPPADIKPLPVGHAKRMPRIQAEKRKFVKTGETGKRRDAVRREFRRGWEAYRLKAWGRDELMPLTGQAKDPFGGWAATLVDALDTLWIMDLKVEFYEAASAAAAIDWGKTDEKAVNLFETTIRHLGGLLSSYELSREPALLQKATELGEMLYLAFDTPNRLPGFWLNFEDALKGKQVAGIHDPSASPSSLVMEFTKLSQLTNDPKFYDATDRVSRFLFGIQNNTLLPGMWPMCLDFQNEAVHDNTFSLGALADSLYEYLPKMHALLGGLDENYETMYRTAAAVIIKHLLYRPMLPNQEDVLFLGDARVNEKIELSTESQHLTCFAGGMFALAGKLFNIEQHVNIGERLARGCAWAYSAFPTGIMPEIFDLVSCPTLSPCEWNETLWKPQTNQKLPPGFLHARDPRYILRPEAIESVFIMYRLTGDAKWQDMAWDMFQAVVKYSSTELANAVVDDVTSTETSKTDSMESFWFSETLKYFYLIFSEPDLISLDEFVLNTEAHPFRRLLSR
ncbi:mannosyl-oligosaccharide alpha-1 2-mannosidase 1B [Fusarium pseudoanthophilum]|uniref:alpha-1,2-Mannosidase n=1 Tax=Fusarium pseudoanthophilum TaxID=48495 RepID=A0A8H5KDV2_9HYPO|nr:mannosyl-oligosaccharide alpha-1 2-mannosidase 1B [Fusarium pseudoanthophilum]